MPILAVGWRQAELGVAETALARPSRQALVAGRAAGEKVGCKWPTQAAETQRSTRIKRGEGKSLSGRLVDASVLGVTEFAATLGRRGGVSGRAGMGPLCPAAEIFWKQATVSARGGVKLLGNDRPRERVNGCTARGVGPDAEWASARDVLEQQMPLGSHPSLATRIIRANGRPFADSRKPCATIRKVVRRVLRNRTQSQHAMPQRSAGQGVSLEPHVSGCLLALTRPAHRMFLADLCQDHKAVSSCPLQPARPL